MSQTIHFVAVEIPNNIKREELETEFPGLLLTKIENSLVAEVANEKFLFVTSFGVLTFCNFSHDEIKSVLRRLKVKNADHYGTALLNQDYPMIVDSSQNGAKIDSNKICYHKFDKSVASIISLVLSQSVGLEKREISLERKMEESKKIYDTIENFKIRDRKELMRFAANIAKERFEIINHLYLLDKPDIIWDDPMLESLYNQLSHQLELKNRFEVIEYKLAHLKESIELGTDLVNQKSSEYLEWIIIWLIVIEVLFSVYDLFFKH